ncbi:MAG TPA: diacylglycerol kinase family protein [Opitutus sp.]|nr:diacylglycerol kinase family protein [Opitutus sp.]
MKIRFIFNPHSGRNARRPWLPRHIREFIASHRLDASLAATVGPGHATELARDALADGCDRIVAVGGDGTINEIGQALLHSPAALGLIPCGSGNGLARHLGLPVNPHSALELSVAPAARIATIDTGAANGRPFFNAMGSGFDAEISRRFNRLTRRGLAAYARTGLGAFCRRRHQRVVIRTGEQTRTLDTLLVAIANSDQYGNGAFIAPGARVDDGQLDLVAIGRVDFASAVPLIARLFLRKIHDSSLVVRLRGARFTIERTQPGLIHTDGETHKAGSIVHVEVRPRSLRLLVPARPRPPPQLPASGPIQCHVLRDTSCEGTSTRCHVLRDMLILESLAALTPSPLVFSPP